MSKYKYKVVISELIEDPLHPNFLIPITDTTLQEPDYGDPSDPDPQDDEVDQYGNIEAKNVDITQGTVIRIRVGRKASQKYTLTGIRVSDDVAYKYPSNVGNQYGIPNVQPGPGVKIQVSAAVISDKKARIDIRKIAYENGGVLYNGGYFTYLLYFKKVGGDAIVYCVDPKYGNGPPNNMMYRLIDHLLDAGLVLAAAYLARRLLRSDRTRTLR